MAQLTGTRKIKTAVFISGTGTNLNSLIKFSKTKKSPITIDMIVSNNHKSKGLQYAKTFKKKKKIYNFSDHSLAEKKNNFKFKKE